MKRALHLCGIPEIGLRIYGQPLFKKWCWDCWISTCQNKTRQNKKRTFIHTLHPMQKLLQNIYKKTGRSVNFRRKSRGQFL